MRSLVRALACAALAMVAVLPATPAHAAPSCQYGTCEGKDPAASGCIDDQELLQEILGPNASVRLMRSRACGATWEEATVQQSSNEWTARLWSIAPEGGVESSWGLTYEVKTTYPYTARSIMRDWRKSVRVCDQAGTEDRDRFKAPSPTGGDDDLGSVCGEWF
ncbi:DUF2690 domain-containing protein [Kitasatospora sp. NPDC058162]|uniref:DUF2690 domain-containing protein n=1 Tax=Kitasatospora sp. NPDC058162 TaxID=3346362 RepID=UPI0036DE31D5